MTKARTPRDSKARKAMTMQNAPPGRRCRMCPFCGPWGECFDTTIRSGRCGDWVWSLRGGRQIRRLWVRPRDPKTPRQRYWRALLGAASRKYSNGLTAEAVDGCIAAGAKLRSRPRLGQSGWLTGQLYWVRQECTGKAATITEGLQTQRISEPTWERCRSASIAIPERCRGGQRWRMTNDECRMRKGGWAGVRRRGHWRGG